MTGSEGMRSMEGFDELLGVSDICCWFPAVVSHVVAFPFNEILILITECAAVQDLFDFIFEFVVDLNRFWRWWVLTVDVVAMPGG